MNDFRSIINPYIVGNPIKSRDMFFGRRDDFAFIKRKLQSGIKSYIIIFCGERRSGKTSILFQILNGELGEKYLPLLIDMQTMAGLKNEAEFFEKVTREIAKALPGAGLNRAQFDFRSGTESPYVVFDRLLDHIHTLYRDKNVLFLIDEYELIETKIDEGSLSPNLITYLAGILESERRLSFIFTGSQNFEDRNVEYWRILFGKSLYRNVSFLTQKDTFRLITEPVKGQITFEDGVLAEIYRLTSGQPFYTQVVCQNMVDHLNEFSKKHFTREDLHQVVEGILENPLPQMIYFWKSLSDHKKLILSLVSEIITGSKDQISGEKLLKMAGKKEFGLNLDRKVVNTTLESLYHQKLLQKEGSGYALQMDLFRLWIKRDHSFWQVIKEVDLSQPVSTLSGETTMAGATPEHARPRNFRGLVAVGGLLSIALLAYYFFFFPGRNNPHPPENLSVSAQNQPVQTEPSGAVKPQTNLPKEKSSPPRKKVRKKTASGAATASPRREKISAATRRPPERPAKSAGETSAFTALLEAQSDMEKMRAIAIDRRAPVLASASFLSAETLGEAARGFLSRKQYDDAIKTLQKAGAQYIRAGEEAITAVQKIKADLPGLTEQFQQKLADMKAEFSQTEEYLKAAEILPLDGASGQETDYLAARNRLTDGLKLLREAENRRKKDLSQIKEILRQYENALKDKNLAQLRNLYQNFTSKNQDYWSLFFRQAKQIDVSLQLQQISFRKSSATSVVKVHFKYRVNKKVNKRVNWEIKFKRQPQGWAIDTIHDGL